MTRTPAGVLKRRKAPTRSHRHADANPCQWLDLVRAFGSAMKPPTKAGCQRLGKGMASDRDAGSDAWDGAAKTPVLDRPVPGRQKARPGSRLTQVRRWGGLAGTGQDQGCRRRRSHAPCHY